MVCPSPALDDLVWRTLKDRAVDFGATSDAAPFGQRDWRATYSRGQTATAPENRKCFGKTLGRLVDGNVRSLLQHQNVHAGIRQCCGGAGAPGAGAYHERVASQGRRSLYGSSTGHQSIVRAAARSLTDNAPR